MNVLVTGAKGFIGRNLVHKLNQLADPGLAIMPYDLDSAPEDLETYISSADVVVHLAGVNRPKDKEEFDKGNRGFTEELLEKCEKARKPRIILSSSIQAALENPYGQSKLGAEEAVKAYSARTSSPCYIFRLPNVFGKWSRPNYNSAVATFCYNIARGLPITVNDPDAQLNLIYIDDVCNLFISAIKGELARDDEGYAEAKPSYKTTVGFVAALIRRFRDDRESLYLPSSSDELELKLYSTYLSFLPEEGFSYFPKMNIDARGSFTELFRTAERGQVSVNITKPGVTKGNHWHHTKNEKFVVVSGEGVIKFRGVDQADSFEYKVSGKRIEIVDIPAGYTHSITNTGAEDLVTIMWSNECFDPDKPDTYYLEV